LAGLPGITADGCTPPTTTCRPSSGNNSTDTTTRSHQLRPHNPGVRLAGGSPATPASKPGRGPDPLSRHQQSQPPQPPTPSYPATATGRQPNGNAGRLTATPEQVSGPGPFLHAERLICTLPPALPPRLPSAPNRRSAPSSPGGWPGDCSLSVTRPSIREVSYRWSRCRPGAVAGSGRDRVGDHGRGEWAALLPLELELDRYTADYWTTTPGTSTRPATRCPRWSGSDHQRSIVLQDRLLVREMVYRPGCGHRYGAR
jgi:hypothetical protein